MAGLLLPALAGAPARGRKSGSTRPMPVCPQLPNQIESELVCLIVGQHDQPPTEVSETEPGLRRRVLDVVVRGQVLCNALVLAHAAAVTAVRDDDAGWSDLSRESDPMQDTDAPTCLGSVCKQVDELQENPIAGHK